MVRNEVIVNTDHEGGGYGLESLRLHGNSTGLVCCKELKFGVGWELEEVYTALYDNQHHGRIIKLAWSVGQLGESNGLRG